MDEREWLLGTLNREEISSFLLEEPDGRFPFPMGLVTDTINKTSLMRGFKLQLID
ncbi:MAG: hypothetical protein RL308_3 [Bacteroidota bacterium]|jgi:hypothetical protein